MMRRRSFLLWTASSAALAAQGSRSYDAPWTAAAAGGVTIEIPPGIWTLSRPLILPKNATLWGYGPEISVIVANHAANGIWSVSSTEYPAEGRTILRNFGVKTSVATSRGAAISNVGGALSAEGVATFGFAKGLELEKTEIADISRCTFEGASQANMSIIKNIGETGEKDRLTNRIRITNCQFKILPTAVGLIDMGGYSQEIRECDFSGGKNYMVISGSLPTSLHACRMDGATNDNIVFN